MICVGLVLEGVITLAGVSSYVRRGRVLVRQYARQLEVRIVWNCIVLGRFVFSASFNKLEKPWRVFIRLNFLRKEKSVALGSIFQFLWCDLHLGVLVIVCEAVEDIVTPFFFHNTSEIFEFSSFKLFLVCSKNENSSFKKIGQNSQRKKQNRRWFINWWSLLYIIYFSTPAWILILKWIFI